MQYRTSRQEVTGLAVNRRINVPHEYRNTVRAMVNTLLKTGAFSNSTSRAGTTKQLHGMLGFIDAIDQVNRKHNKDQKPRKTFQAMKRSIEDS